MSARILPTSSAALILSEGRYYRFVIVRKRIEFCWWRWRPVRVREVYQFGTTSWILLEVAMRSFREERKVLL
jgi:hypothetical protein